MEYSASTSFVRPHKAQTNAPNDTGKEAFILYLQLCYPESYTATNQQSFQALEYNNVSE
jgi:hypothetical protein